MHTTSEHLSGHKLCKYVAKLTDDLVVSVADTVGNAAVDVTAKYLAVKRADSRIYGSRLRQNIRTVRITLNHCAYTAYLPLYTRKPVDEPLLCFVVANGSLSTTAIIHRKLSFSYTA